MKMASLPEQTGTTDFSHTLPITGGIRNPQKLLRNFAFIAIWVLPIMAFTMPVEEQVDSWQPLDVVKLIVLSFACFGGTYVTWLNIEHPRFKRVVDPLIPFFLFFAFTLTSALWSPLRSVTIFQSGCLVAMLIYSTAVAFLCRSDSETSVVLRHLCQSLVVFSGIVLVAFLVDPELSGLDRSLVDRGGDGIIHPTASGGTASLGLLLLTLCHVIGKYSWTKRLLLPGVIIHGSVLLISNSRTASGLALAIIASVIFWYCTNQQRAIGTFACAMIGVLVLIFDPGFQLLGTTLGASAEYVSRGQSSEQLSQMSGRAEMWRAVWAEFGDAMMFGHGYFVTSAKGEIYVWYHWDNHSAHNMFLQVLVTTGAFGLVLFLYSLLQPWLCTMLLAKGTQFHRRLLGIISLITIWFFGWSLLSESFMGPIRPESIVFFSLLGIAVGQASQINPHPSAD